MGFFFTVESSSSKKVSKIPLHTAKELECKVCPRAKIKNQNPKMEPSGVPDPLIYILKGPVDGEEDFANEFFASDAGTFLLNQFGSSEWSNVLRINSVLRCAREKAPTEIELICCRNSIEKDIALSKPEVIVAVGEDALKFLVHEGGIQRWRGRFVPITIAGHVCWMYPVLDPQWIFSKHRYNHKSQKKDIKTEFDHIFIHDFKLLQSNVERVLLPKPEIHTTDYLKGVKWVDGSNGAKDLETVIKWLAEAKHWGPHALDIETTHLRPYEENTKILTMAIGTYEKTYAFPIQYPKAWTPPQSLLITKAIKEYLLDSDLKICHNTKFELEWLSVFFGDEILTDGNFDDTMAAAYSLDERRGMLSLDRQCFLHFGFNLKDLSNIDRRNMLQYPLPRILPYNGLDTKWTHKLWLSLMERLKKEPKLTKVHKGLKKAVPTLTGAQKVGICVDYELRDSFEKDLTEQAQDFLSEIKNLPEVKKYENHHGAFNPDSPHHLMKLLRDVLGLDEELRNNEGKYSTGEPILKALKGVDVAPLILKYRAISKKMSTYITPLVEHCYHSDGRLHTNFNLYETGTGRLCVAKGTQIEVVRDLSKNPIGINVEDVKLGDLTYTFDEDLNLVLKKVTWAGSTGHKKVIRIHWRGLGGCHTGYLDVTKNHPIRLINGEYRRADKLKPNDRVLSITKSKLKGNYKGSTLPNNHIITKIEKLPDAMEVFDLGVEDTHNFIANGLCVSNSSNDPNMQNWPNRKGREIRKLIIASLDNWLLSADYGQIEARILGVASQDQVFCDALWNNYDVHMEWAEKIAYAYPTIVGGSHNLNNKEKMKKFRKDVKNQWVFPAFYGASIGSISKGVGVPYDITKALFREFWATFKGVKKWQKWQTDFYNKHAYVETLTGRRRHGPLSYNAAVNAPIQGTASDICVNAMNYLAEAGFQIIMNIHDDITSYVEDDKLEPAIEEIAEIMCITPYELIPNMNVPISVEISVGKNWCDQEEVGVFTSTEFMQINRTSHVIEDFI